MLFFSGSLGILPKSDVKSDVGLRWQGLAGRGKSGSSRSIAIPSPQRLAPPLFRPHRSRRSPSGGHRHPKSTLPPVYQ